MFCHILVAITTKSTSTKRAKKAIRVAFMGKKKYLQYIYTKCNESIGNKGKTILKQ